MIRETAIENKLIFSIYKEYMKKLIEKGKTSEYYVFLETVIYVSW
jgi:hypothetical protein